MPTNEPTYTVSGHIYESKYSYTGYRWAWAVIRTEPDSNVDYDVDSGTSPYRWLSVLKARWAVRSDRRFQRRKNNPISIHIGGENT